MDFDGPGLLTAPALAALGLVAFHALRYRLRWVGWFFLAAAFAFGVLRGNFISWFMTDAASWLGLSADFGFMPYVVRAPLLRLGTASLLECCGWVIALYLGWALAEDVLRRLPGLERRLFALVALAAVFTAALGYAVEAGANAMQWWTWTLPVKSRLLAEVPAAGLWAWFSVGFVFLVPFLLLAGAAPKPGPWRFLTLLIFPAHMASNLLDLVAAGRPSWLLFGEPSWLAHLVMLAAALGLAAGSRREVGPALVRTAGTAGAGAWLPAATASLVLSVLWLAVGMSGRFDLGVATAPLLVFILLAVPSVPLSAVTTVALLCAPLASWRGLAALVPLLVFGVLHLSRPEGDRRRLRWLLVGMGATALALLLVWQHALRRAERAYVAATVAGSPGAARQALERFHPSPTARELAAGHALADLGRDDLAARAYAEVVREEPLLAPARNALGLSLLRLGRTGEAILELQTANRILPDSAPLQHNLGLALLAAGRLDEADRAFQDALLLQTRDARPWIGLAHVARTRGHPEAALRILEGAQSDHPEDAELQLALGALHQDAGRAVPAEKHLRDAIALDGSSIGARCRLAVLLAAQPGRLAEARSLAFAAVAVQRSDLSLDTLGIVLLREGNVAEARAVLEQALAYNTGGPLRARIVAHLEQANDDWLLRGSGQRKSEAAAVQP